jgi:hypothetical protein
MARYALFGCKVKNSSKEIEGGWHDCLATSETIEELKANFRTEEETYGIIAFNEATNRHEKIGEETVTHTYFLKQGSDLAGNPTTWGHRIDWYQIVDLQSGEIVEEFNTEEE